MTSLEESNIPKNRQERPKSLWQTLPTWLMYGKETHTTRGNVVCGKSTGHTNSGCAGVGIQSDNRHRCADSRRDILPHLGGDDCLCHPGMAGLSR